MEAQLNISERVYTIALLNQYKGDLSTLVFIMEDLKASGVTDAEWEKAERKITTVPGVEGGEPMTTWSWDDEKGGSASFNFNEKTVEYLKKKIEEKNTNNEFTLQDKAAISLKLKLDELK